MKRLFGENALDRGLLRRVVAAYAQTKGMEYEAGHQKLSRLSEIEGPFQEITPDPLLRPSQIVNRNALRARRARARLKVDHFKADSDPDGAGFRGYDPPTVEGELDSMFETGG